MSETKDTPVIVEDVTYIYRTDISERRVLDDVSMRIEPGALNEGIEQFAQSIDRTRGESSVSPATLLAIGHDRLEARVRSYEVGGESANVWAAEETPSSPEIEEELQQLKNKVSPKEPARIETDSES